MTPYEAKEQLQCCWERLHMAVADLKEICASCIWMEFEDNIRFRNIIGKAREAERIARIQLDEWEEEDDEEND